MGSHGIGVTRNDYHRRNRRRNISMHKHSHGRNVGGVYTCANGVRVVKKHALTSEQVLEFNAREESRIDGQPDPDITEDDEIRYFQEALSSLDATRFLYLPPFLKAEEIKRRRFSGEMNDDWWKWEDEVGVRSKRGRPNRESAQHD